MAEEIAHRRIEHQLVAAQFRRLLLETIKQRAAESGARADRRG